MRNIILLAALAALLWAAAVPAQDKRESQLRTVHGVVLDKEEAAVTGGVVYLKNTRTQVVATRIVKDKGEYSFSGLDPNVDYEIHAEKEGMTSAKKTVSSFDSRKDIVVNLKVDKKKE
ncbi:MAG TPA: carboxypeptidase-like regulatory domain-containing protein [Candidatus Acidoferrales bacterium]|nr:carboxypeptidase-like regulatory domain-containing protein [Candidatus Acidoferrales bacterium]